MDPSTAPGPTSLFPCHRRAARCAQHDLIAPAPLAHNHAVIPRLVHSHDHQAFHAVRGVASALSRRLRTCVLRDLHRLLAARLCLIELLAEGRRGWCSTVAHIECAALGTALQLLKLVGGCAFSYIGLIGCWSERGIVFFMIFSWVWSYVSWVIFFAYVVRDVSVREGL